MNKRLIPEARIKKIVSRFYARLSWGDTKTQLIRELAQVCYSEGYSQALIDLGKAKNE